MVLERGTWREEILVAPYRVKLHETSPRQCEEKTNFGREFIVGHKTHLLGDEWTGFSIWSKNAATWA